VEFRIRRTVEKVFWTRCVTWADWPVWDGYVESGACDYWSEVEVERARSRVGALVGNGRYIEVGYE
jgi:hypothetical protein